MMRRGADRSRLRLLQWLSVVPFLILALRLFQVQVIQHEHYLARALRQWQNQKELPAQRGNIYDRHDRSLALSITTWRLGVAGANIQNQDANAMAAKMAPLVGQDAVALARLLRKAQANRAYVLVDRRAVLHRDALNALRRLPGIELEQLDTRSYPIGGAGASLLGFCNPDSDGKRHTAGLERTLDEQLAGQPGRGLIYMLGLDASTAGLQEIVPPRDGRDVVLTIDADLQLIAEQELAAAVDSCNAAGGVVLIVDPRTGDILAAADTPVLGERSDAKGPEAWDNFVFTGAYEPGSIFKIFTAASL
ncbi:MAG: penicillin-binding transpeptidase domain-containing protein, partial [Candidatus Latescibacteria bacterium]|nr:penicillin-binding transpeptidase domain-containing protein [Candidatus Latescibacterota bacterium]